MGEDWHPAVDADSIEEEDVVAVEIRGQAIAVYRVNGEFYATEDRCTHGGAALSEGVVLGEIIECALHQGRFCIRTGQAKGGPVRKALRTFPTKVADGRIYVQVAAGCKAGE